MNVVPMPGHVFVEPILRADAERTTTIKNFQFKDPEFQGAPNIGKIHALPEGDDMGFAVGEKIVFKNDPLPDSLQVGELKLFAVKKEDVLARLGG